RAHLGSRQYAGEAGGGRAQGRGRGAGEGRLRRPVGEDPALAQGSAGGTGRRRRQAAGGVGAEGVRRTVLVRQARRRGAVKWRGGCSPGSAVMPSTVRSSG